MNNYLVFIFDTETDLKIRVGQGNRTWFENEEGEINYERQKEYLDLFDKYKKQMFTLDSEGRPNGKLIKEGKVVLPHKKDFYWRTEDSNELYIDLCVVDEDRELLSVGRLFMDGSVQMLMGN